MRLEQRRWRVRLGQSGGVGIEFTDLDIDFSVSKTLRPEPNTCSLTVYNLKEEDRRALEKLNLYDPKGADRAPSANRAKAAKTIQSGTIRVEIEAGYKDGTSLIFRGDLRRALSTKAGADWVTVVEGEDGGRTVLSSRVQQSFPAGTPVLTVVTVCATALGLGLGNIGDITPHLAGKVYRTGTVLDGPAARELTGVLAAHGIRYSVQNGVLQFRRNQQGAALTVSTPLLSSQTGLIGMPHMDATGELVAECLMIPDIAPGGYVTLATDVYRGVYQIVAVEHMGQSSGAKWGHTLNLRPAMVA